MSDETSTRLGLPYLQSGQAQKEMSHNDALCLLDLAVQASVEAVGLNVPPATPADGACWIVGSAPSGIWSGHAHALAGWTAGGWRYVAARTGMSAWSIADGAIACFDGSGWAIGTIRGSALLLGGQQVVGPRGTAIADAAGGTTVDVQARTTIAAVLAALRSHGLIAT